MHLCGKEDVLSIRRQLPDCAGRHSTLEPVRRWMDPSGYLIHNVLQLAVKSALKAIRNWDCRFFPNNNQICCSNPLACLNESPFMLPALTPASDG